MRIAVIGAGGIGGYYGARLQQAGHEVVLVARGAQLAALREQGLRVVHPDFHFASPVTALDMAELLSRDPADFDVLILAVKAGATAEIARSLGAWYQRAARGAPVLSLQNGVDNEPTLAAALGEELVLGGLSIRIGTHIAAPGRIEATGPGQVTAGLWPCRNLAAEGPARACLPRILAALEESGVPVVESDDIRRELWRKLVINNGVNPLSALTGWDSRRLTRDELIGPLVKRLMHETVAAARADDVVLDSADVEEMFSVIHDLDAIKTSMLVDREHGRPLELQAICGAVLERARRLGQDAPGTEMVAALLTKGVWAGSGA